MTDHAGVGPGSRPTSNGAHTKESKKRAAGIDPIAAAGEA